MGTVERLSIPGPGRTLLGETEARAQPLRQAAILIERGADARLAARFDGSLGAREIGPYGASAVIEESRDRAAWALVAMWLLARLTEGVPSGAGLADAEEWFDGRANLAASIPGGVASEALGFLNALQVDETLADLLPYVLDPVGLGTRRAVIKDATQARARTSRKAAGVYYTPSDVADFMLNSIGALDSVDGCLIDPACGSGVFLRAALRRAVARGSDVTAASHRLYGIDISAWAIELCAFVLTAEALILKRAGERASELWKDFRTRLMCADALSAEPGTEVWFPSLDMGFDYLIANPPYAPLKGGPSRDALRSRFRSLRDSGDGTTNTFVPFVELMWQLGSAKGVSTMVVPLSISYSSTKQIEALRRAVQEAKGDWQFAFFDRTPDALFGDDVKQRCAIMVRRGDAPFSVATGPLRRWTSRTRSRVFSSISYTSIEINDLAPGVPKVGSELEAEAYRGLRGGQKADLSELWVRSERVSLEQAGADPAALLIAGTAYNWVSVLPDAVRAVSQISQPTASPLIKLSFVDVSSKWAAYAALSSRISYWLWRVEGDGFHVPKKFVASLPVPGIVHRDEIWLQLAEFGRSLWSGIVDRPIVSTNGGRETVTYCPYAQPGILDSIDEILLNGLKLPEGFGEFLKHFVLSTTVVDFEDPNRVHREGRTLTGWVAV